MSIAITDMSTLLSSVKTILLGYQNSTLSKVNTFQRGCLSPMCVFPALAIMPIRESFIYGFSNSKYEVEREIEVGIYDIKLDTKISKDNTISLIKEVKNIFEDNFTFSDTCYFSRWGHESYGETIEVSKGFLFNSYISLVCKSRELFPTMISKSTVEDNPSIVSIQNKLVTLLKENKSANYNTVVTIAESPISPIPLFPAILVGAGSLYRIQEYPNINVSNITFDISILSQLFHKETSLNQNLLIVEGVKNVLQQNYTLDGMCEFNKIDSILYNQEKVPSGFIYSSVIRVEYRIRETL